MFSLAIINMKNLPLGKTLERFLATALKKYLKTLSRIDQKTGDLFNRELQDVLPQSYGVADIFPGLLDVDCSLIVKSDAMRPAPRFQTNMDNFSYCFEPTLDKNKDVKMFQELDTC